MFLDTVEIRSKEVFFKTTDWLFIPWPHHYNES